MHDGRGFDRMLGPSDPPTIALKMAVRAFVMMLGTNGTRRAIRAFMARATAK
jgi:hypothetical protein